MFDYHVLSNIADSILTTITSLKRFWSTSKENDIYNALLVTTLDGIYGTSLMTIYNPLLDEIKDQATKLSKTSVQMLRQSLCGPWICEALREANNQLTSGSKHIIICDGFALHDALFLAYKFESRVKLFLAINPGGKTKTYEYLIKHCPEFKSIQESIGEEVTLSFVGKLLSKALNASYEKFDEFDKFVHSKECLQNVEGLGNILYRIMNKLYLIIKNHIDAGNGVLLLADHGYDISLENFTLYHEWTPYKSRLSILAPFMVMK